VPDHNVPTTEGRDKRIDNEESRIQVEALDRNARDTGIHYYPVSDIRQASCTSSGPSRAGRCPA
jgi:3-isopropylmalate/(R)-2-methylmalate dehydratase large subunit